jgi:myo-inositol-1(or 4)-monophosphatase
VAVVLEEDGEPLATAVSRARARRAVLGRARRGSPPRRRSRCASAKGAPLREAVLSSFLRADKLRGTPPAASLGRLAEAAAVLRMGGAGSLELAWVAAGHIDAWAQPNVDAWDWLPGRLLVQEAGGRAAVVDGDPLTWFVAGAPGTFEELVALVSAALRLRRATRERSTGGPNVGPTPSGGWEDRTFDAPGRLAPWPT